MKHFGLFIATLGALALTACHKPGTGSETTPISPVTPPPSKQSVVAVPATSPAVALPPARELAPEGIFYLRIEKSVTTPKGVVRLAPSTLVRRTSGGEYLTEENYALRLSSREITNDLAEARQILSNTLAARERASASPRATPPPPRHVAGQRKRGSR